MQKINDLYEIGSVQIRASQNPTDLSFEFKLELAVAFTFPDGDNFFYNPSGFSPMKEARFFKENFSEMLNECYFGGKLPEISKKFVLERDEPRDNGGYCHYCTAKASLTEKEFRTFDENYDFTVTEIFDVDYAEGYEFNYDEDEDDNYAEDEKTARKDETISNLKMAKRLVRLARKLIKMTEL